MKKKLLPLEQQNKSEVMLHHDDMRRMSNDTNDGRRIIIWRNANIFVLCACAFSLLDRYRSIAQKELLVRAYGPLALYQLLSLELACRPLQRRLTEDSG